MTRPKQEPEAVDTAHVYQILKTAGYDGPVTLHCKSGVPQIIELGDRRWKLI